MGHALIGDPVDQSIVEELEQGLNAIFGVQGGRVILDEMGEIREVHVITSPKRSPKKIVRDIETFFAVRHRRRVDYRCISCVQLSDDAALQDRLTLGPRARTESHVELVLSDGTQQLLGRAPVDGDPVSASAHAAVAALNQLWGQRPRLKLIEAQIVETGQRQLVLVYIIYGGRSVEHLTGTSFVRGEAEDSAARAVLAAVNRRLRAWLSEATG